VTLESHLPEVHDAMVGARAFAETVEGVREALDAGLHTITNTTLTRRNLRGALETVDFLHALGLRTFAMNGIIHAGGGRGDPDAVPAEEMAPLLAAVRDRAAALGMRFLWYTVTDYCRLSPVALGLDPKRCNAAEYSMCVEPNGDVLPCQSYYVPAGNLLRDPWEGIWESDLFRRFREREAHPREAGLPEPCWDCPDLPTCGGGCPLEREAAKSVVAREGGCGGKRSSAGGGQGGG
jgi:radical SAM protein with 4Fe4S-binding SPASM domain